MTLFLRVRCAVSWVGSFAVLFLGSAASPRCFLGRQLRRAVSWVGSFAALFLGSAASPRQIGWFLVFFAAFLELLGQTMRMGGRERCRQGGCRLRLYAVLGLALIAGSSLLPAHAQWSLKRDKPTGQRVKARRPRSFKDHLSRALKQPFAEGVIERLVQAAAREQIDLEQELLARKTAVLSASAGGEAARAAALLARLRFEHPSGSRPDFRSALDLLEFAQSQGFSPSGLFVLRALIYRGEDSPKKAAAAYQRAAETTRLSYERRLLWRDAGSAWLDAGDFERAKAAYLRADDLSSLVRGLFDAGAYTILLEVVATRAGDKRARRRLSDDLLDLAFRSAVALKRDGAAQAYARDLYDRARGTEARFRALDKRADAHAARAHAQHALGRAAQKSRSSITPF